MVENSLLFLNEKIKLRLIYRYLFKDRKVYDGKVEVRM